MVLDNIRQLRLKQLQLGLKVSLLIKTLAIQWPAHLL